jgi:hypothetical protein
MNDPKRLTETGAGATHAEERLLLAGQQQRLLEGERSAIWASIAAQLPAPVPGHAASGPGASGAASAGAAGAALIKGLVTVAVVGASVAAGYGALRRNEPVRRLERNESAARTAVSVALSAARAEAVEPAIPLGSGAVEAPAVAPPTSVAGGVGPSQLHEESLAVLEVRKALRTGDAGSALKLLEQARVRFPRGALGQEREALTIEALAQSGARAAAERRAAAFLRAYPKSPYAADVQGYLAH